MAAARDGQLPVVDKLLLCQRSSIDRWNLQAIVLFWNKVDLLASNEIIDLAIRNIRLSPDVRALGQLVLTHTSLRQLQVVGLAMVGTDGEVRVLWSRRRGTLLF